MGILWLFADLNRKPPAKTDPNQTTVSTDKNTPERVSKDPAQPSPVEDQPRDPSVSAAAALPEYPVVDDLALESEELRLELSSVGATIKRVLLKKFEDEDYQPPLELLGPDRDSGGAAVLRSTSFPVSLDQVSWEVTQSSASQIVFSYALEDGRAISKTISFGKDPYLVDCLVQVKGVPAGKSYRFFGPKALRYDGGRDHNKAVFGRALPDGSFDDSDRDRISSTDVELQVDPLPTLWAGVESNFFASILRPVDLDPKATDVLIEGSPQKIDGRGREPSQRREQGLQGHPYRVGFEVPVSGEQKFEFFFGPKDRDIVNQYRNLGYDELIDYGYLGPLVRIFLVLLGWFHAVVRNYGLAIILLTFLVKLSLHPIQKKNQAMLQRQQKKMAKIQPDMQRVREQYKNDPLKMNQELQKLMREHGFNPAQMFGGCMLIFLQLPIWIGLISTFSVAIELRHESFLFVSDLTQPDRLFPLGFTVPLLGWTHFNILPLCYVALTIINQRLMPKPSNEQMAQQQKIMTFMLVAFGFIFYHFASGLMLYFMTSAALGIVEQRIIRAELRKEGLA